MKNKGQNQDILSTTPNRGSVVENNFVGAIHYMKISIEFMNDFIRQYPGSKGAKLMTQYVNRLNWILTDIKTSIDFPQIVRDGLKREIESDVLLFPEIINKIHLLEPAKREFIETIVDKLLNDETIEIEIRDDNRGIDQISN